MYCPNCGNKLVPSENFLSKDLFNTAHYTHYCAMCGHYHHIHLNGDEVTLISTQARPDYNENTIVDKLADELEAVAQGIRLNRGKGIR